MNKKVSEFVREYVEEHLDKSDPKQEFEVFVVWQCYILGNAKWLLSTTLPDGMYYEVTYNKAKDEFYLDALAIVVARDLEEALAKLAEQNAGWRIDDLRALPCQVIPVDKASVIFTELRGMINHL